MALRINDSEYYAIDSHSHLGKRKTPLGHGVASFLGDDLVRNLDEVGLDCAVAFPLGASYTDYSEANQIMADEMAKYPQRIIAFCRINPNFGPEATEKSLDHCLGTLKLKGIKLHPEIEFFLIEFSKVIGAFDDFDLTGSTDTGIATEGNPGFFTKIIDLCSVRDFEFDIVNDDFCHVLACLFLFHFIIPLWERVVYSRVFKSGSLNTMFFSGLSNL